MPGSKFACYRIAGVRHALSVNSLNSQGVLRDMTSMRQNLDSHLTEATAALELVLEEGGPDAPEGEASGVDLLVGMIFQRLRSRGGQASRARTRLTLASLSPQRSGSGATPCPNAALQFRVCQLAWADLATRGGVSLGQRAQSLRFKNLSRLTTPLSQCACTNVLPRPPCSCS